MVSLHSQGVWGMNPAKSNVNPCEFAECCHHLFPWFLCNSTRIWCHLWNISNLWEHHRKAFIVRAQWSLCLIALSIFVLWHDRLCCTTSLTWHKISASLAANPFLFQFMSGLKMQRIQKIELDETDRKSQEGEHLEKRNCLKRGLRAWSGVRLCIVGVSEKFDVTCQLEMLSKHF